MKSCLDRPIVVLGAARSGTYLLASIIKTHEDVAYMGEPNYVWKYSNAWLKHDMIPRELATPRVKSYIRTRFHDYCQRVGRPRFCEKTPANSLRLPFVLEVLPGAKVIHIVRNGRDVALSARKKFQGDLGKITRTPAKSNASGGGSNPEPPRTRNTIQRLISIGKVWRHKRRDNIRMPARDAIHYLPEIIEFMLVQFGFKKSSAWGPRIPGLRRLMRSHSLLEVCAIQWRMCVEHVVNYAENHPKMDYLQIKYEELCDHPFEIADRVFEFCELSFPSRARARLTKIKPYRPYPYAELMTPVERERLDDQIAHTLRVMGYET